MTKNDIIKSFKRFMKERGNYALMKKERLLNEFEKQLTKEDIFPQFSRSLVLIGASGCPVHLSTDFATFLLTNKIREDILSLFVKFLEKEKALTAFEYELVHNHSGAYLEYSGYIGNVRKLVMTTKINPFSYIDHAFRWSDSEQGHAHWHSINYKWVRLLYFLLKR